MIRRKSQQEMVGFVLIIIIVAVVSVIFLGISLRSGESGEKGGVEASYFLRASMQYTTDCAISYEPDYDSIQDLIKSCYNTKDCLDGRRACDVLNSTFSDIMNEVWLVGEDRPVKAYELLIYYKERENGQKEEIWKINNGVVGNCSLKRFAEESQSAFDGRLITRLDLCYT